MAKSSSGSAKADKAPKATRRKASAKKQAETATPEVQPSAMGEPVIKTKTPPRPRAKAAKAASDPVKQQHPTTPPRSTGRSDDADAAAQPQIVLSHDEVAKRAFEIWVRKGRPYGQDDQNWHEAEYELLSERAR